MFIFGVLAPKFTLIDGWWGWENHEILVVCLFWDRLDWMKIILRNYIKKLLYHWFLILDLFIWMELNSQEFKEINSFSLKYGWANPLVWIWISKNSKDPIMPWKMGTIYSHEIEFLQILRNLFYHEIPYLENL